MPTIQQTYEPPRKKTYLCKDFSQIGNVTMTKPTSSILENPQSIRNFCFTPTSDASDSTNRSSCVHITATQHTQSHIMETSSTLNSNSSMIRAPINEERDSDSSGIILIYAKMYF